MRLTRLWRLTTGGSAVIRDYCTEMTGRHCTAALIAIFVRSPMILRREAWTQLCLRSENNFFLFFITRECGVVMHSVASVCSSVYNSLTFESLDLKSTFFGTQIHLQNPQVRFVISYINFKIIWLRLNIVKPLLCVSPVPAVNFVYFVRLQLERSFFCFAVELRNI